MFCSIFTYPHQNKSVFLKFRYNRKQWSSQKQMWQLLIMWEGKGRMRDKESLELVHSDLNHNWDYDLNWANVAEVEYNQPINLSIYSIYPSIDLGIYILSFYLEGDPQGSLQHFKVASRNREEIKLPFHHIQKVRLKKNFSLIRKGSLATHNSAGVRWNIVYPPGPENQLQIC